MRLSRYFLPVLKEDPKEADIVSHRYMLRAGMIKQQNAGLYVWLPLGKRVLDKIYKIIKEEQDLSGALEILMPTIQPANIWQESGRYDDYGKEMLRIKDRHDRDLLYSPTNEEAVTDIFRSYVRSYKDLPLNFYQVQWKFRDEIRPRFGVLRAREFLMKDAYSFDIDYEASKKAYDRMFVSYLRIFDRIGVKAIPMQADTGPIGGSLSHEFIILAETGESKVFYDKNFLNLATPPADIDFNDAAQLEHYVNAWTTHYAATEEMLDNETWSKIDSGQQICGRGIEVGHIFHFGTKYSSALNATVTGEDGKEHTVLMGSYGIGLSRVVAAIIESSYDSKGIIWPKSVAPFHIGLINMKPGDEKCDAVSARLYEIYQKQGYEVLLDDTSTSAGVKFATMDLIGLPQQVVIGPKGLLNDCVEIKDRATGERVSLSIEDAVNYFQRNNF